MAGRGTRATATDYNNIQTIVASVLGVGSGSSGYGQAVASAPVAAGSAITVSQWTTLRTDLSRCRVHQTNTAIIDGLASISANRGSPWQTLQTITSSTTISEDIRDQYNLFASGGVNGNRDTIAATGQSTANVALSSTPRSTNWGGATDTISHTVTLTFAGYTPPGGAAVSGANHMRCFFNAGGTIDITASRTGGTGTTKDTTWTGMIGDGTLNSGFGTLRFRAASCTASGAINSPGSVNASQGFRTLFNLAASFTGNVTSTATTTTITGIASTSGLVAGMAIIKSSGTGAVGGYCRISSVDSATQITIVSSTSNTAGSMTFFGGVTCLTQAAPAGQYVENRYIVTAHIPTTNQLVFTVWFQDNDAGDQTGSGAPVDEEVTGTLTSTFQCTRASGSNVDVPAPGAVATAL